MAGHKHPNSPNRLTEFAPLSSEAKQSGGFFSRLFKKGASEEPQLPHTELQHTLTQSFQHGADSQPVQYQVDEVQHLEQRYVARGEEAEEASEGSTCSSETPSIGASGTNPLAANQPRNLSSVLKRLSNILDSRGQTPQAYKDSDFKQYWMPDSNCKQCYECGYKFHTFRRRHHCRICGQIFCSRCCNQEVPGRIMGYTGYLRVCTYCCKVVLSYAQNPDASGDVRSLSEDLEKQLSAAESDPNLSGTSSTQELWSATSRRRSNRSSKAIFDEDASNRQRPPDVMSPPPNVNPFDVTPQSEYSSMSFQEERKILLQDSAQLRELWSLLRHPIDGVELQSHRHRLRTYPYCFVGSELIDWLMTRDRATSREQAIVLGQALVDAQWLECVTSNEQVFRDEYALYKPGKTALNDSPRDVSPPHDISDSDDESEPLWFKEIKQEEDNISFSELSKIPSTVTAPEKPEARSSSVFYVGRGENAEPAKRPKKLKTSLSTSSSGSSGDKGGRDSADGMAFSRSSVEAGIPALKGALAANSGGVTVEMEAPQLGNWQHSDDLREENGERLAFERLSKAQREHMTALTKQLLSRDGLSLKWSDTILGIVWKISSVVRPDVRHDGDDMDIRQYVQIKKIPGGSRSHTSIVSGVVCSKNVAHKKMEAHINNPKILLLRAPIEYQRVENKFSSLEPQILQEHEFLKNCVGRISSVQPDILMVEKTVSRVAQEFLYDAGITLVLNVKPSVMARVSRFTQADINTSPDSLVSKTNMGFCHTFKVQSFTLPDGMVKTLMYFDGCASHLGCTVTLRGGTLHELKRIKRIIHFMTYVAYHLRLEMSFLMDEFAMPPPAPDESTLDLALSDGSSTTTTPTNAEDTLFQKRMKMANGNEIGFHDDDVSMFSRSKEGQEVKDETKSEGHTHKDARAPSVTKMEVDSEPVKDSLKPESQGQGERSRSQSSENLTEPRGRESSAVEIEDFSDPLHSYQISKDEAIFQSEVTFEEDNSMKKRFKKALGDVTLSISPYIRYDIPYLETDSGTKCKLRSYFGQELYWSVYFSDGAEKRKGKLLDAEEGQGSQKSAKVKIVSPHPFVTEKLTKPLRDLSTQALLADFRASGGTIQPIAPRENGAESVDKTENAKQGTDENFWKRQQDCLDPHLHQRIAVLFGSYAEDSANAPYPCVQPWVVSMDHYGRNDITMGGFLERYCFRESYKCPSDMCDTPMVDHVRRFVHETGCLQVVMKRLDTAIPAYQNNILMWGWCKKCRQVTPVVPMSLDTWSMSFAKYLELRFHGDWYGRRASADPCPHSLHHDHIQYFGYKQTVVSFKHYAISLREVALPPMLIGLDDPECPRFRVVEEAQILHFQGTSVYSSILEHLHRLKRDVQTDAQALQIGNHMSQLQVDKELFRGLVDQLQLLLPKLNMYQQHHRDIPWLEDKDVLCQGEPAVVFGIQDLLVDLKRHIAESVVSWNNRIHEIDLQQKKMERSRILSGNAKVVRDNTGSPDNNVPDGSAKCHPENEPPAFFIGDEKMSGISGVDTVSSETSNAQGEPDIASVQNIGSVDPAHFGSPNSAASTVSPSASLLPASPDVLAGESVSSGSSKASSHSDRSTGKPDFGEDVEGQGEGQKGHRRTRSSGDSKKIIKQASSFTMLKEGHAPDPEKFERRATMKNLFTTLLSSSEVNPIQMPFNADEHHNLPAGDKVPIVVYDQEPSSIIAYALSSAEYERELQQLRVSPPKEGQSSPSLRQGQKFSEAGGATDGISAGSLETGKRSSTTASVLSFFRGQVRERERERSPNRQGSKYDVDTVKYNPKVDRDSIEETDDFAFFGANAETDKSKTAKQAIPNYNIELQFSDPSARFYCRVYYAEQFAKLRKLIFPSGEDRYIRSLSRCFTWLARGGKSGSTFCKTQDDRFILKQMSKYEVLSFVDFAPHYLQYITKAHNEQKPTVLAKILGVYRIGYRNNQTNTALKQDVLVMENLFYERQITQIFDLKGSMRNRLVSISGKRVEDLVLLDENLLKTSTDSPLYIRPHSKTVLTLAITNDTQFLSSNLVMDYSLLVGLDDQRKELVVGIIDYIRTFTWDKKLEMLVKSQLGGQGRMPTVVSPELYRGRFLEAMDRYFFLVPDRWTGLGKNVDC